MPEDGARKIVLAARPTGKPTAANFRLETFTVPSPGNQELLLRTIYLSLDPYMRGRMDDRKSYAPPVAVGDVMVAESVTEVVLSNRSEFKPGDIVLASTGWQTHCISNGQGLRKLDPGTAPITTGLGVLGMPGFTAYSGMRVIGQPKAGETVVVAAASGPVGSLVGQLAQLANATAVGIAGGPEKCAFVRDVLGFDQVIDHKSPDFAKQLEAACPKGIDVYFENVGGEIWQAVLPLLNKFARVPVCGLIAQYNATPSNLNNDSLAATMREILSRSLTVRGFINFEFANLYPEFLKEVGDGIRNGRIKYREDIVEGLENAPEAFMGMLEGKNYGKALVKVS